MANKDRMFTHAETLAIDDVTQMFKAFILLIVQGGGKLFNLYR